MSLRVRAFGLAVFAGAVGACGGGAKQADSPTTCPDGTVLTGADCVPSSSVSSGSGDESPKSTTAASDSSSAPAEKTPFDRESVDVELKRAIRQVKKNCGAATDENGSATGPWGPIKVSITLGRNGHVKQVTVPAPFDGKPVGTCVVHAFEHIQFPPYAAPTDSVVDRDIELVQPKK